MPVEHLQLDGFALFVELDYSIGVVYPTTLWVSGGGRGWRFDLTAEGVRRERGAWQLVEGASAGSGDDNAPAVPLAAPPQAAVAAREAPRQRVAAAARAADALALVVRPPVQAVLDQLLAQRRVSAARLNRAFEIGQLDAIVAAETCASRPVLQVAWPRLPQGEEERRAECYAVLVAPERDIVAPRFTRTVLTYRLWVAPRQVVPQTRGRISFSPCAVSRGFASLGEARAWFAGAGYDELPQEQ